MKSSYFNSPKNIETEQPQDINPNSAGDVLPPSKDDLPSRQKLGLSGTQFLLLFLLNALVWAGAYVYLKRVSPVYASRWGIIVLGAENSHSDVALPDSGRASSSSDGGRTKSFEDARGDYIYIAESSKVISKAAEIASVDKPDFGKPEITADEGSAIISFVQTADTPELANRKSLALYSALNDYIEELRQSSLYQKKSQNNRLLQEARTKVKLAQERLAAYQSNSLFGSDEQLDDLATGIEELRRLRADYSVQARGLGQRIDELGGNVNFQPQDASDAYKLQADEVYQQQLAEYGRLSTELSRVSSELSSQHPESRQVRQELDTAERALEQRGSILLGRSTSINELTKKEALITDPQVNVVYTDLFKEAKVNRADKERFNSQEKQLSNEIKQMETRLKQLSREKLTVDRLRRDLQVSEAVLASKVTKLDFNQEDIYSIYPPIQLVIEPTTPDKGAPISPSIRMVFLTALAGSFLLTSGLLIRWGGENRRQPEDVKPSESYLSV